MSDGSIGYTSHACVATITIDRPAKRNALSSDLCNQLRDALLRLRDGDDRVGVLCGSGSTFCAGADLTAPPPDFWQAVPDVGIEVGKPIIAAVQGPVVGLAVTLVTYCDLCVAAEDARFLYPEAKVGVSKGLVSGLVVRMPHKIAMELMLLGGPITAQRAHETGFVNRVTAVGAQIEVAQGLARQLADSAPLVLAQLKSLTRSTLPSSPAEALYRATATIDAVTNSADAREGLLAFREKRAPRFTGR